MPHSHRHKTDLPDLPISRHALELILGSLLIVAVIVAAFVHGASAASASPVAKKRHRAITLRLEKSGPQNVLYRGRTRIHFHFKIAGSKGQRRAMRIQVRRSKDGKIVRSFERHRIRPGKTYLQRWNGSTKGGDFPGHGSRYCFRVQNAAGKNAGRRKAAGHRCFNLRSNKFPLRAKHTYGEGFGAGRGHDGQDVFASCGSRIEAARAGRVTRNAYQSAAGNYLVINGSGTKRDYVYMHMQKRSPRKVGTKIKAGQRIGNVGQTGDATGCHLHFELWQGTWYAGGHPRADVGKRLRKWDRWS